MSTDQEKAAIETAFSSGIAAAARGDIEAYLDCFDDEAVLVEMLAGQKPVVGKQALRVWIADFFENYTFGWSDYDSEEIVVDGTLAFQRYRGVASFRPKAGGETVHLRRRYLDILRRDSKREWRIWHHVWSA